MRNSIFVIVVLLVGCSSSGGGSGLTGDRGMDGGSGSGATSGAKPGATPVTLGPDLSRSPDNEVRCVDGWPIQANPSFPQTFYGDGQPTCLLVTFLAPDPNRAHSTAGIAVSATIRVGAVTGAMRFVKMRILYQNTMPTPQAPSGEPPRCCSVEQFGEIFTPTANTTTVVPLGFEMQEDDVPAANDFTTIAANDLIGIEVLGEDTPLPGFWSRNGGQDPQVANYGWYPALSTQKVSAPSDQLAYSVGFSGFVPTFNLQYVSTKD